MAYNVNPKTSLAASRIFVLIKNKAPELTKMEFFIMYMSLLTHNSFDYYGKNLINIIKSKFGEYASDELDAYVFWLHDKFNGLSKI